MARTNRVCKLCGTPYYYCPTCEGAGRPGLELWHTMFHDEECYRIFNLLQKNSTGSLSNEETAKQLSKCNLSVLEGATEIIKKQVADIFAAVVPKEEVKPKKARKKTDEEN